MAQLIKAAKQHSASGLKRAGDAHHDPADLSDDAGARLVLIPLDQLSYNPENPRDEDLATDPATLELAESMKWLGQQQPGVVVSREVYLHRWPQHADVIKTPSVLMDGNRRCAAATINGWHALECIVRDKITKEIEQLSDLPIHVNLHRKGINPLRMAYYLADQVKLLGSERAVAKKVGKTQPWVNQLLKLLKLIPELQALVKSGEIIATTGRALAKLSKAEQRRIWEAVAELSADEHAEFWATGAWNDKRFIIPTTVPEEPNDGMAAATDTSAGTAAGGGDQDASAAEKAVSIVIPPATDPRRLPKLAAALRRRLSAEEVSELAEELAQSA